MAIKIINRTDKQDTSRHLPIQKALIALKKVALQHLEPTQKAVTSEVKAAVLLIADLLAAKAAHPQADLLGADSDTTAGH